MLDTLLDALLDTAKTLPFLYVAYLIIGLIETKASQKMQNRLSRLGPLGPIGGAVLGVVPQCGFSVAAANFFSSRIVTMGTVVAVFLSTSDEAIPILVSHPESFQYLWKMILLKLGIAIIAGLGTDFFSGLYFHSRSRKAVRLAAISASAATPSCEDPNCTGCTPQSDMCTDPDCGCGSSGKYNIFLSALIRMIQTGLFILAVNLVLGYAIYWIGEDTIGSVLLNGTVFQPFIAALIGFIPNCAASVILTELFTEGALSFGSCVAGLCTGAGIGLAVLFRSNRNWKQNLLIVGILYGVSVAAGLLVDLILL